jgi:hypothetical protein
VQRVTFVNGVRFVPDCRLDRSLDDIADFLAIVSDEIEPGAGRKYMDAALQQISRVDGNQLFDPQAEAGIEYVADWVLDDQPVMLTTRVGNIVSIPYTVEINDVVISAVQQHRSDEIYLRGRDHFDRLYLDGATTPRVMAISIHPYLTGVPHRIKYLEMLYDYILVHDGVVMWTGAEILDWYRSQLSAQAAHRRGGLAHPRC